jgi:hypothetical protein
MTSSEYIDKFIILQAKKLQEQKFYLASVMVMTIGLEVMGGFFDKKPLKSPKQSKIRFKIAVDKLLGGKYSVLNNGDYLYDAFRNQLVHSLLAGKSFQWDLSEKEAHLVESGNVIYFNPKMFLADIEKAALRLKQLLKEGKAIEKRIPDNVENLWEFVL